MRVPLAPPPPASKEVDVVCLGESSFDLIAVLDRFPEPDAKVEALDFASLPGGQAATAAVTCARQGWRARYIGCLGLDSWGDQIVSSLLAEGVEPSVVRRSGARSRTAIIIVERATGRRTIIEHRDEKQRLREKEVDPAWISSGRVLLVDATDIGASANAARIARKAGIPTVVDVDRMGPGVDALLDEIDVMIVTSAMACAFAREERPSTALSRLVAQFRPAVAIATLGSQGSIALCDGREIRTPPVEVPVVDTIGAGDAFRGGFIAAWLRFGAGASLDTLLQYANATAALNCGGVGAQAALPNRQVVDALVTRAYGDQSK